MTEPLISVIIPTWNRGELLRSTLAALAAQTLEPERFEVIVVDDGSTDATGAIVAETAARVLFRLLYHRMPVNGGPVLARNQGARLARAEIFAFTDSDCQPCPPWLEVAAQAFHQDPELGFLTGPVINTPGQRVRFFSVGGADCAGENPTYPAANVIYRKRVFWDVGAFDPTAWLYNAGPTPLDCSDVDLAWRVKERGFRNRFLDELLMHHEVRQLTPWQWLAHYTRILTIPELVRRHPGFGKSFLWWGPFCLPENPLFYLGVAGAALGVTVNPAFALLALPFLFRLVYLLRRSASLGRLPFFAAQVAFLWVRQAVICGSLIYGSVRSRTLVL